MGENNTMDFGFTKIDKDKIEDKKIKSEGVPARCPDCGTETLLYGKSRECKKCGEDVEIPLEPDPKDLIDKAQKEEEKNTEKKEGFWAKWARERAEKKAKKNEDKEVKIDPEKEINKMIEDLKPDAFEDLSEIQKIKVVRDLKHRVVDLVKSDAQTQYSEELKEKIKKNADPELYKRVGKTRTWLRNKKTNVKASFTKELDVKNIETAVFKNIKETAKDVIKRDLELLVEKVSKEEVGGLINENRKLEPYIVRVDANNFEENTPERKAIEDFNDIAEKFSQIPYEWGQEKEKKLRGNRRKYEKIKADYDEARNKVLQIKENTENEKGGATFEMLQIDNAIKMEQLLNTHPEFEQALKAFGDGVDWKDKGWAIGSAANTISGQNVINRALLVGGFAARTATKFIPLVVNIGSTAASATTLGVGAAVGGITGGIRGWIRAKETLEQKQKAARHGEIDPMTGKAKVEQFVYDKDGNPVLDKEGNMLVKKQKIEKKLVTVTKAEHLSERLEKLINEIAYTADDEEKTKKLGLLATRIEHTQGKIEKGQVNFGDTKSALVNQYNLINSLNDALVLRELNSKDIDTSVKARIDKLLGSISGKLNEQVSGAKSSFIKKQALIGARNGAALASVGYVARYVLEHAGWSLGSSSSKPETSAVDPNSSTSTTGNIPEGSVDTIPAAPKSTGLLDNTAVHKGQGIENAFIKQIENNPKLAQDLGFKGDINDAKALHSFSQGEAHRIALENNKANLRISAADKASYKITGVDNKGKAIIEEGGDNKKYEYEYKNKSSNVEHKVIKTKVINHDSTIKRPKVNIVDDSKIKHIKDRIEENIKNPEKVPVKKEIIIEDINNKNTIKTGTTEIRTGGTEVRTGGTVVETGATEVKTGTTEIRTGGMTNKEVIDPTKTPTPKPTPDEIKTQEIKQKIETTIQKPVAQGTPFEKNIYGLSEKQLVAVNEIHNKNINSITESQWEYERKVPVKNFLGAKSVDGDKMVPYLNNLQKLTGLKPLEKDLLSGRLSDETIEEYTVRALQEAARRDLLDKVKIE